MTDWWMWIIGKAAKEEALLSSHEQGTSQDHPRAGRGLWLGERQLRQRAQTQRGNHCPQVRPRVSAAHVKTEAHRGRNVTAVLSSGGRRPVPNQAWRLWSSGRRWRGRLLQSLISNSTAASKNCVSTPVTPVQLGFISQSISLLLSRGSFFSRGEQYHFLFWFRGGWHIYGINGALLP